MKNSRQYLFCIVCSLLFIGCASRNSVPEPENYMKVFPADGQLYLQLPVRYNRELALQVVEMLLPDVENADSVLNRIDTAYICVRNRKIYAVATGAFPSVGRNFILLEKNGWKKIQDESLPVTGICYESLVVPYQIAFPSSSTVVLGESVQPLLVSWGNRSVVPEQDEPAAFFSDAAYDGNSIDFCIQNLQELVPLAAMAGLHIPVKDMYGTLTPEAVSDDGLMDVTVIPPLPFMKIAAEIRRLFDGSFLKVRELAAGRCCRLTVAPAGNVAEIVEVDGEIVGKLPATFEVLGEQICVLDRKVRRP